jgi:[protein-PII] uridylyltransferase
MNLRTGAARAIRLMHEHGVLARLIPEFGAIGWHYQYDFYHAFTTDEHSLRTVEHLESMAAGGFAPFPQMHEVMADVTARGALYLAGLLHDIGKAEGAAHSAHSERLAARALRRLGCDERTVALVRFLIREHLLMSHVTQRRDTDDPETIRDFIGRVRSAGRLRMLTALTFADLSALSEGALSDWKKTLLWSLYTRALLLIEQEYEHSAPSLRDTAARRAVERLRARIPEPAILTHLNSLPEQYLRVTPPSEIGAHIRGISLMERRGAWASFHRRRGLTYLTVICRDYPSALSDICGAITASDINIVAAQIFTRGDGVIIDTFLVVNGTGETRIPPESQRGFKRNFFRVIAGEAKASDLIHDHILRWRRRKKKVLYHAPRVRIDNTVSSAYTVVDVFASDYTGLLYDITSVLASYGMDIHTARIGTDEDQAADAFYIRKSGGGKIEDKAELEKLTREIVERLEKMRQ